MTKSELNTVLTVGMATVASNVLALYVLTVQNTFPTIAGHLISASVLSIPAALILSKLIIPETEKPATLGTHVKVHYEKEKTLFSAIIKGAEQGVKLIVGIVSLLIALLGLVALVDLILGIPGISLKEIFGYVFYPFTLIMGVPVEDAFKVSQIIGERIVLTEVKSYLDLALAMKKDLLVHGRSAVIAAYALCGFAHIPSLAIFIGGVSALAPERRNTLARIGFRALLAATLATLMTGAIAGTFYHSPTILFGK